jgi:hypothetical protein
LPETTYSTEERVVGTWIDGKKIHEKTISDLSLVLQNEWINLGSSINNILTIINSHGVLTSGQRTISSTIRTSIYNGAIQIYEPDISGATLNTLTVYYTKTTD